MSSQEGYNLLHCWCFVQKHEISLDMHVVLRVKYSLCEFKRSRVSRLDIMRNVVLCATFTAIPSPTVSILNLAMFSSPTLKTGSGCCA